MKNEKEEIIVGLDIGTSKICVLVGLKQPDSNIKILGMGTAISKGLKKGCVLDIEHTAESVLSAINEAEDMADVEINHVLVSISGNHIKSFNSYGSVPISHDSYEITPSDVQKALDTAKAISIPMEQMVFQVIPHHFTLDGQTGIKDPKGMSGVKLEAGVHVVTGSIATTQNIIKCLNRSDLEFEELVLGGIASAEATLSQEEIELGVVLIDIGGGTTDIVVYTDENIKYTDVLPGGGNQITNDIAIGLRVPLNKAEEIKKTYGSALRSLVGASEEFIVPGVFGRSSRTMQTRDLTAIVEARLEENFLMIKKKIEMSGLSEKIGAGIVVTGGSALMKDIEKLATKTFNIPTRIGHVTNLNGMDSLLESPLYATAAGLLLLGSHYRKEKLTEVRKKRSFFQALLDWIRQHHLKFEN